MDMSCVEVHEANARCTSHRQEQRPDLVARARPTLVLPSHRLESEGNGSIKAAHDAYVAGCLNSRGRVTLRNALYTFVIAICLHVSYHGPFFECTFTN